MQRAVNPNVKAGGCVLLMSPFPQFRTSTTIAAVHQQQKRADALLATLQET